MLRRTRIIIPTLAAVAVLGVGGTMWSSSASADPSGSDLDRASSTALEAVGEGKVTDTETDDEEGAYEIEVTKDDGAEVDVHLDKAFNVLSQETEDGNEDESGEQDDD